MVKPLESLLGDALSHFPLRSSMKLQKLRTNPTALSYYFLELVPMHILV